MRFALFLLYLLTWKAKLIQANQNERLLADENTANDEAHEGLVNGRISILENEVAQLKSKRSEDGKLTNLLMGRIERLEASPINATNDCECEATRRLKRPVRLLPAIILR